MKITKATRWTCINNHKECEHRALSCASNDESRPACSCGGWFVPTSIEKGKRFVVRTKNGFIAKDNYHHPFCNNVWNAKLFTSEDSARKEMSEFDVLINAIDAL